MDGMRKGWGGGSVFLRVWFDGSRILEWSVVR